MNLCQRCRYFVKEDALVASATVILRWPCLTGSLSLDSPRCIVTVGAENMRLRRRPP